MPTNPHAPDNASFPRCCRLARNQDFDAVFARRLSASGGALVLYGRENGLGHNRLGLAVGRRYGNAVERNRFKRVCREAFRLSRAAQPIGWDWIALPRLAPKGKGGKGKKKPPPKLAKKGPRISLDQVERELVLLMQRIAVRSQDKAVRNPSGQEP